MSIEQYLRHYACPEVKLANCLTKRYSNVVVIPVLDERITLLDGLEAATRARPGCLTILIVNNPEHDRNHWRSANEAFIHSLVDPLSATLISASPPSWLCSTPTTDVLIVDRCRHGWGLPPKQGVGLARRIGCDIALGMQATNRLETDWIHMTDGDVTLPETYFEVARGHPQAVALTYPFHHRVVDQASVHSRALALYDVSLHYYVLGLRWARSGYAHYSIGSTIAVRGSAYASVRGMPRREAGEDFYFLNKLAKLGPIEQPKCTPIQIHERHSERVPFGTGAANARIARHLTEGGHFMLYNPTSFVVLKRWLNLVQEFASGCPLDRIRETIDRENASWKPMFCEALDQLSAVAALAQARRHTKSYGPLRTRLHEWFDGFRTMKFLHALRDAGLPDCPWREAVSRAPFVASDNGDNIDHLRKNMAQAVSR